MLRPLMEKYNSFLVTEKTAYQMQIPVKTYYLKQVNRKEITFFPRMIYNFWRAVQLLRQENPDVVISTGALASVPVCLIARFHRKKLIYIESFARVTSASITGRLMYHLADQFYVQWQQMLEIYPDALFFGGIY